MPKPKSLDRIVKPMPLGQSLLLDATDANAKAKVAAAIRRQNRKAYKRLIAECERLIAEPIPARPYSLFNRFRVDGDRKAYEAPYTAIHLVGLPTLRLGALLSGRDDILARLQDYLWEICNYDPWAFPAHVPAQLDPERPVVDLFAAITAEHVGETLDLLADRLGPEIVARCRHEVFQRVLEPVLERPDQFNWAKNVHNNWSAVCFGAVGCAGVLTRLERKELAALLETCREGMMRYFKLLDPGDGVAEGVGYWRFAMVHAARFADLLERVTRGKERMLEWPALRRAGRFPVWCFLPPDRYVNLSDCTGITPIGRELAYLLMRHGDCASELAWLIEQPVESDAARPPTLDQSVRAWMPPKRRVKPQPPKETIAHFKDMDWVIVRESWDDPDAAVLAAKAGHNAESHNQVDVGQFIYHVFGQSYAHDIGRGTYCRAYFGPNRYDNPFCSAEGHNTIFINRVGPGIGAQHRGEVVSVKSTDHADAVTLDLTALYPPGLVKRVTRRLVLSRECKPRALRVTDVIEGAVRGKIEVRVHVGMEPKVEGKRAVLDGERGRVRFESLSPGVKLAKRRIDKLDGDIACAHYLRLTAKPKGKVAEIEYAFAPQAK